MPPRLEEPAGGVRRRLFRIVASCPDGIELSALYERLYTDADKIPELKTVAVHISCLNKHWLRPRGWQIKALWRGRGPAPYKLVRYDERSVM